MLFSYPSNLTNNGNQEICLLLSKSERQTQILIAISFKRHAPHVSSQPNSSYPVVSFELIVCPITHELLGAWTQGACDPRDYVYACVCVIAEGGAKDLFRSITSLNHRGVLILLFERSLLKKESESLFFCLKWSFAILLKFNSTRSR